MDKDSGEKFSEMSFLQKCMYFINAHYMGESIGSNLLIFES